VPLLITVVNLSLRKIFSIEGANGAASMIKIIVRDREHGLRMDVRGWVKQIGGKLTPRARIRPRRFAPTQTEKRYKAPASGREASQRG
jgi:hypothetical protein